MPDIVDQEIKATGTIGVPGALFEEPGRAVTARGTEQGLVVRIDGKAEWSKIISDLEAFLGHRKKFFDGAEVSIEWLERLPTKEQGTELEELLKNQYGIKIVTRRKRSSEENTTPKDADPTGAKLAGPSNSSTDEAASAIPLFDSIDTLSLTAPEPSSGRLATTRTKGPAGSGEDLSQERANAERYVRRVARLLGDNLNYEEEEEANARVIYGTLRSGQKIETPYSLVVVGDVNPGADISAGGDIIILGNMRGTAHASAYDDDGYDSVIIALQMQPMQLRIGSVISRGSDEVVSGAEIARIENRRIIVESFSPRVLWGDGKTQVPP